MVGLGTYYPQIRGHTCICMTYFPFIKGLEWAECCEELSDVTFIFICGGVPELGSDRMTVIRHHINQIAAAATAESLQQGEERIQNLVIRKYVTHKCFFF
jgi:hypothetical protein